MAHAASWSSIHDPTSPCQFSQYFSPVRAAQLVQLLTEAAFPEQPLLCCCTACCCAIVLSALLMITSARVAQLWWAQLKLCMYIYTHCHLARCTAQTCAEWW